MRQRIMCRFLFLASSPFHLSIPLSHPSLSEQDRTANWTPLWLTSLPFCLLLSSSSPSCSVLCHGTQLLQWVNNCTGKALMGNNCNLQMPVNTPLPIGDCSANKEGNGKHRNMCTCCSDDRHLIFFLLRAPCVSTASMTKGTHWPSRTAAITEQRLCMLNLIQWNQHGTGYHGSRTAAMSVPTRKVWFSKRLTFRNILRIKNCLQM